MGSPNYPRPDQQAVLMRAAEMQFVPLPLAAKRSAGGAAAGGVAGGAAMVLCNVTLPSHGTLAIVIEA